MIRVEGLRLAAGSFTLVLDGLTVEPGEYLVMTGPTGAGKTVLLETLAGLRRPQAGRIWLGGRDMTEEPPERRRVGFVYQDYALFPHLTVADNIAFGLAGKNNPKVRELAALLGLEPLLSRHPSGLSGGEQQRVALARALAIEPGILLLDEPLSALDQETRGDLRGLLGRINRELKTTVLHVTHDLDEALALGDRMAVLIGGRVRQIGRPAEVLQRPADVSVARLLGLPNVLPATVLPPSDGRQHLRVGKAGAHRDEAPGEAPETIELVVEERAVPEVGATCWAVIRPEEIHLGVDRSGEEHGRALLSSGAGEGGAVNVFEGKVRAIRLLRTCVLVEVELPPLLTACVLGPDVERMALEVGKSVSVRVPPGAVHCCQG